MKRLVLFLLVISFAVAGAQSSIQKISDNLDYKIKNLPSDTEVLIWAFFKDKGSSNNLLMKAPAAVVSQKSLERRSKNLPQSSVIDITDLPVNQAYINELNAYGFKVKQLSKWLNGVSGYVKKSMIANIANLNSVSSVDIVYQLQKEKPVSANEVSKPTGNVAQPAGIYSYNYGDSYTQNQLMNVPAAHNLGYTGKGVVIGVFDAGFNNLKHEVFDSMKIIARYDFVNNRVDVADGNGAMGTGTHGTMTLSSLGGYKPGKLIGPAFGAKFVLAKTENTESETPIEEDNWIRAIEWADSIGIDVASTSLGYLAYDAPYVGYTWQSMDGKTCRITKAADLAFLKGIVVINSAGNEGYDATHNTLGAPADGIYVIAAGAVTAAGVRSSFSSVGNTVDGRIKPDIMAMGSSVTVASPYSLNGYTAADGTSFSCPLSAGVAAVILSAKPNATAAQVRDAIRSTASKSLTPDREYGWGIINATAAISSSVLPVELSSFSANISGAKVELTWKTLSEKNNRGFEIERAFYAGNTLAEKDWISVGFVKGNGTTTAINEYSFSEVLLQTGKYLYRLKQTDFDGNTEYSNQVNVVYVMPGTIILNQNYPNPFNPSTTIEFSIPVKSNIKLSVYNILGMEVSTLYNGSIETGIYRFQFDGSTYSSGSYFVRLTDGKTTQVKKILLMK